MKRRAPDPAAAGARPARCRFWGRWCAGLAAGLTLLGLGVGYCWRFGLSELPEPLPEVIPAVADLFAPAEDMASNFWHVIEAHLREASRKREVAASEAAPQGGKRSDLFDPGGNSGEPAGLPVVPEETLREALALLDWRPPQTFSDWVGAWLFYWNWPDILSPAERAASGGEAFSALERLAGVWQLLMVLWNAALLEELLDERGVGEVHDRLVRPFGAWVLYGPGLGAGHLRQVLDALEVARSRADGPEVIYARQAREPQRMIEEVRRPPWSRVSRAARVAGWMIRQDTAGLVTEVWDRLSGWRRGRPPNYHGALHLLKPLSELAAWVQARAARQTDFERIKAACLSRTLDALRRQTLPAEWPLPAWLAGPGDARPLWQRWLDRPAVWRVPRELPPPQPVLQNWRELRWALDACRIMTALRAYREEHGHWPARLEELVPAWLDALPPDPFQPDTPLRYTTQGEDWQLEVANPTSPHDLPVSESRPTQRVLRSKDFLFTLRTTPGRN